MTHREVIKEYLGSIELRDCSVLDAGSGTKPVKNYIKHEGVKFLTIDKLGHVGADLVANLEDRLPGGLERRFDHAFLMEVLEHTEYPLTVLKNMRKALRGHGHLHLSVPFAYRVHADDDYHRYTIHGLRKLVGYAGLVVEHVQITGGDEELPVGYIVRARKPGINVNQEDDEELFDRW